MKPAITSKEILRDPAIQNIRKTLEHDYPELAINTISLITNGWDNVAVEVNSEYIFRFPKDEDANFDLEIKILEFLQGKVKLQIPRVEFLGKDFQYMGYRKI